MPFAYINFVDPNSSNVPDNTLPEGPDGPEGPVDPGFGVGSGNHPSVGPIKPSHPRPWPPLPPPVGTWPPRAWPPSPVDPDWGIDAGITPGEPIFVPPGQIDNALPPVAGTKPPQNPPPGTIWPPIAGSPDGTFILLAWFYRVGWRYVVVDSSLAPGTPLPPEGSTEPEPKA